LWLRREFADSPAIADNVVDADAWQSKLAELQRAPLGTVLLAQVDDVPAGCAIVSGAADAVAELKNVFVRPAFKGHGVGCRLLVRAAQLATERGYRVMRMQAERERGWARQLRTLGFSEIKLGDKSALPGQIALFEGCTAGVAAGGFCDDRSSLAA